jgi:hypothetical protein
MRLLGNPRGQTIKDNYTTVARLLYPVATLLQYPVSIQLSIYF